MLGEAAAAGCWGTGQEGGRGAMLLPAGSSLGRASTAALLAALGWEMLHASPSGQLQPSPGPPCSRLCYCALPIPRRAAAEPARSRWADATHTDGFQRLRSPAPQAPCALAQRALAPTGMLLRCPGGASWGSCCAAWEQLQDLNVEAESGAGFCHVTYSTAGKHSSAAAE